MNLARVQLNVVTLHDKEKLQVSLTGTLPFPYYNIAEVDKIVPGSH